MISKRFRKNIFRNAKKYVEQNYRVDDFKQQFQLIMLILNIMKSENLYRKDLYDSLRIKRTT